MVASSLAKTGVKPDQRACEVCSSLELSQQVNKVTLDLAIYYCKDRELKRSLMIMQRPKGLHASLDHIINGTGVGSQLWNLLSRLGIQHDPDCSCVLLAETMNDLGPVGCREKKEHLLKLMRKNQTKYGWSTYLTAGVNAIILGWVFKLNPLDPLPGLLDHAIKLAEQTQ